MIPYRGFGTGRIWACEHLSLWEDILAGEDSSSCLWKRRCGAMCMEMAIFSLDFTGRRLRGKKAQKSGLPSSQPTGLLCTHTHYSLRNTSLLCSTEVTGSTEHWYFVAVSPSKTYPGPQLWSVQDPCSKQTESESVGDAQLKNSSVANFTETNVSHPLLLQNMYPTVVNRGVLFIDMLRGLWLVGQQR